MVRCDVPCGVRSPYSAMTTCCAFTLGCVLTCASWGAVLHERLEDETNALFDRVYSNTHTQKVVSPDGKLIAVYSQTHPGATGGNGRNFGLITIYAHAGRVVLLQKLASNWGDGRLVAVARWSPDSKFCVFSTISAEGHSPWHFDPYVFSLSDRRIGPLDDSVGAVVDWNFKFTPPDTLYVMTRQGIVHIRLSATGTN